MAQKLADLPLDLPVIAPPEDAWQAMSPSEREGLLVHILDALSDPAGAMTEGRRHKKARTRTLDALGLHFGAIGRAVYLVEEMAVLYPGEPVFSPDVLAVVGVVEPDDDPRMAWVVADEGKGLDLVIEVLHHGSREKDLVDNVERYARLGIPEYFVYDRLHQQIYGYRFEARDQVLHKAAYSNRRPAVSPGVLAPARAPPRAKKREERGVHGSGGQGHRACPDAQPSRSSCNGLAQRPCTKTPEAGNFRDIAPGPPHAIKCEHARYLARRCLGVGITLFQRREASRMRRLLGTSFHAYELLWSHERHHGGGAIPLRDEASAGAFARSLARHVGAVATLRRFLSDELGRLDRSDDGEVLGRLAALLVAGRVRVVRLPWVNLDAYGQRDAVDELAERATEELYVIIVDDLSEDPPVLELEDGSDDPPVLEVTDESEDPPVLEVADESEDPPVLEVADASEDPPSGTNEESGGDRAAVVA